MRSYYVERNKNGAVKRNHRAPALEQTFDKLTVILIPHLGLPYFQTFSKTGYEVTVIFHLLLLDESVKMARNPLDFFLEEGEDADRSSMKRRFD